MLKNFSTGGFPKQSHKCQDAQLNTPINNMYFCPSPDFSHSYAWSSAKFSASSDLIPVKRSTEFSGAARMSEILRRITSTDKASIDFNTGHVNKTKLTFSLSKNNMRVVFCLLVFSFEDLPLYVMKHV